MNKPLGPGPSSDREQTSSLTADLQARIARAKSSHEAAESAKAPSAQRDMSGMGRGLRLGSEFLAAILVGAVLGYLLDQGLGTTPWLMLVMLIIGFAAGVLNVVRTTAEMNRAASPSPDASGSRKDEQDE
jgi:ATP synthase protein I